MPTDQESVILLQIFNNTPFTFGQNGINGFNYQALSDNLRWAGLSRKKYTSVMLSCCNMFIKGTQSK